MRRSICSSISFLVFFLLSSSFCFCGGSSFCRVYIYIYIYALLRAQLSRVLSFHIPHYVRQKSLLELCEARYVPRAFFPFFFFSVCYCSSYMAHIYVHTYTSRRTPARLLTSAGFVFVRPLRHYYDSSASFNNPSKLTLFGLSIGSPNARSQTNCASGPRPRETPKVAV